MPADIYEIYSAVINIWYTMLFYGRAIQYI